jgi:predicted small metal-binding protein
MTTPAFAARDNVPGCVWQVEGDELDSIFGASQDHLIDQHLIGGQEHHITYTHVTCGVRRPDVISMRWHLYMGCRPVAAVGS